MDEFKQEQARKFYQNYFYPLGLRGIFENKNTKRFIDGLVTNTFSFDEKKDFLGIEIDKSFFQESPIFTYCLFPTIASRVRNDYTKDTKIKSGNFELELCAGSRAYSGSIFKGDKLLLRYLGKPGFGTAYNLGQDFASIVGNSGLRGFPNRFLFPVRIMADIGNYVQRKSMEKFVAKLN